MKIVVALGGNALLRRGEAAEASVQQRNVEAAAAAIAQLADEHELVVTHGNGPQVGLLALQAAAYADVTPYPLDVLGAESEGMIGYLLEQSLRNALPERSVATLLTQVVVDPDDPAFLEPTKPIGPLYDELTARRLAGASGWTVAPDGDGWRRVVPSPAPTSIVELSTIRLLLNAGVIVVCAGGGGIPVVATESGGLRGVEAVIDKDLASGLLAELLSADRLLLLTDVEAVELDHGSPGARPLGETTPDELRAHVFAAGSMGPKVEAACRFVDATGGEAGIGLLSQAAEILAGTAGTRILPTGMTKAPRPGDWIVQSGRALDAPGRRGMILEVLGAPDHLHYRVRWDEEHESIVYPAGGVSFERPQSTPVRRPTKRKKKETTRKGG
jgi:carbamate kinase